MNPITPPLKPGQKHVIVVGAGFAGLSAAKQLCKHPGLHVTVVDQRNHHLFQPLLYQVATAGLNPSDIAVPIRSQFAGATNVSVHLGRVTEVNLREKWVGGEGDVRLRYDYLVLAGGAQHSYFGKPQWEEFAPGLKTLEQATEIRRRILRAFEEAENELDPQRQRALLNFVVVGAGPTGVEMAGAIADISRTVLVKDFRRINPRDARVVLLEAGPRLLPSFSEKLGTHAGKDLQALGVEVRLGARVTGVDAEGVSLGEERIAARTVIWAAGVEAERLTRVLGVELDRAGRVKVEPDLSLPGFPDAFAVGDLAHVEIKGQLVPGVAPAAIQMGEAAARNVVASISGRARAPFRYKDKGAMATIGKHRAIAETGKLKLTGYPAWVAWLFVHIFYLIGFKNRATVFTEWTWNYLFSRRGARLITERDWRLRPALPAARPTAAPRIDTAGAPATVGQQPGERGVEGARGTDSPRVGPTWS
ncbi:NAD(P)/FAD-dependent oxidoreductase [Aggregicoccus sp. 17bor-14]|uniref:NAD(P)/FAD-dependent oxidoreductase n=1 Tax=Myxococcaceae TaxID=31 RepID=UPI00129D1AC1|nr:MULTISPECIES: NAD(P)/FAD-dependent oxidoreductase [Myxococcaceae]MBF5045316.1 NAD(P)/FAD-dependent oxidoreductase [Simulacricoccus sp. 17bor-14]MRI91058.1 NAD(P)/FAD-dependent oxidoreductase [Aggregicoccus sp. 17bor-14]